MDTGTTISVTFAELAMKLGLTVPSTKNLVRRKKWSRHAGNDGLTRIIVPVAYIEENASTDAGTDAATPTVDTGTEAGTHLAALAALERQIERLERENAALKNERDVLASMPVQIAALRATLEAVSAERDRLTDQVRAMIVPPRRSWWPWKRTG
jgi:transposase-like protein